MVDLLTAVGKTTLTTKFQSPGLKVALWRALGSGVSLFCSCWGSLSGGKDSRSSLQWHPHQKPALCLHLCCTQTNAPAIKMNLSLLWWSVVVLETRGPASQRLKPDPPELGHFIRVGDGSKTRNVHWPQKCPWWCALSDFWRSLIASIFLGLYSCNNNTIII